MTRHRLGPPRLPPGTRLVAWMAALMLAGCPGRGGDAAPSPTDTTPPTVPAGLTATPTSATSAALSWSAATDAVGVTAYEVLRDGAVALTTASTGADDAGLAPLTRYCWAVRARDAAGNLSGSCPEACATTPAPPDVGAPAVVGTTPAPGATDVATTAVFTASFDEAVDPATLQGGGFTLRDAGDAAVAATVTWDAPALTATLTPSAPLENLGSYTAVVGTAVADVAGNHLAAEARWTVRVQVKELLLRPGAGGVAPCVASRIVTADFDQDGHLDVAFVCSESHVWVALGDGAGGFGTATGFAIPPRAGYGATFLYGVAAADLDGDGYPDLAAADGNGSVDVLLNEGAAAPGTLGAPVFLTAGMYTEDVVAADLDGDGNVDLASADLWSNRVSVFLGTGGGAFAPAVPYDAASPGSLLATRLRPGGPIDLVPSNGPVLLGDGDGGFTPSTGDFAPGIYPMNFADADLDRDGKMDLVVANQWDHVTLLFGDGTGAFPDPTVLPTERYPQRVVTADLNGDGWPDLLVVLYQNGGVGLNTTLVLLGTGGGEFGAAPIMMGDRPFAVADLDGDGKPDLLGSHFNENPWGSVLDAWLNATP